MADAVVFAAFVVSAAAATGGLVLGVDAKRRLDRRDRVDDARRAARRAAPPAPKPDPPTGPRAGNAGNVRLLGDARRGPGEAG